MSEAKPLIGIVMGSSSDWEVMQHAVAMLKEFGVPHEAQVISDRFPSHSDFVAQVADLLRTAAIENGEDVLPSRLGCAGPCSNLFARHCRLQVTD